jgi:hypothetical protein
MRSGRSFSTTNFWNHMNTGSWFCVRTTSLDDFIRGYSRTQLIIPKSMFIPTALSFYRDFSDSTGFLWPHFENEGIVLVLVALFLCPSSRNLEHLLTCSTAHLVYVWMTAPIDVTSKMRDVRFTRKNIV